MVFVKKKKEHIHKENSKNTKIVKNRKVKNIQDNQKERDMYKQIINKIYKT